MKKLVVILLLTLFFNQICSAAKFNFPHNFKYPFGTKPNNISQNDMNKEVQKAFEDWKNKYLTEEGCAPGTKRVQMGKAYDFGTTSEGIGFGMLILAYMENPKNKNQKDFDALWKYYKRFRDAFGLMNWKISKDRKILNANSASEADINVASALLIAHKVWGSNGEIDYSNEAHELIAKIKRFEIEKDTYILKPGDTWGGSHVLNPMYFCPAFLRMWSQATKDNFWGKVIKANYAVIKNFNDNYETGLVPDWSRANGQKPEQDDLIYRFEYNACQFPLKMALDYAWFGNENSPLAYFMADKTAEWIKTETENYPSRIRDGYELNGQAAGKYNNGAFVGPFCAAGIVDKKHQEWLDTSFDFLRKMRTGGDWGYYPDTLRLISMLFVSGNMPNPYKN